jgi:hypothetical protein
VEYLFGAKHLSYVGPPNTNDEQKDVLSPQVI